MTTTYLAPSHTYTSNSADLRVSKPGVFQVIFAVLRRSLLKRPAIQLCELNDHLLRDIGSAHAEAEFVLLCRQMGVEKSEIVHSHSVLQRGIAAMQRSTWLRE